MLDFNLCEHLGRDKKHLFQKVLDITKANPAKLKFPMWASEKFDGVFCAAIELPDGDIGIFSRTGERYTSMKHIEEDFKDNFAWGKANMILFEAYCFGKPQSVISGWCRDTKAQHPGLVAMIHTYISDDNWVIHPLISTSGLGATIAFDLAHAMYVRHQNVQSLEEAQRLAQSVWDAGGEGIVLSTNHPYQPGKRNESMVKIKKILTYDLEVIDVYEGRGKYTGTLGGLVCRWKDGKTIKVSGMTDDERKKWWTNPSEIIGKIVEVHAMTESSKGLLREPRYKGIRYDKLEADV